MIGDRLEAALIWFFTTWAVLGSVKALHEFVRMVRGR